MFSSGRVGNYAAKCHKYNHDKGKDIAKGYRRRFDNNKIYYTLEDSDGL